ncbi:MAG: GDP-mannose 4,6-dehydratase [Candidatus Methanospirareceae archaeon]
MSKKALITGVTGQDGAYLSKFLLEKGYEVYGLVRRSSSKPSNLWRLEELGILEDVNLIEGDLSDQVSLNHAIREVEPDEVYNLGAQSFVAYSFKNPTYTGDITGLGVIRVLEAIRNFSTDVKFYQASSSEMYGKPAYLPLDEKAPFHPRSPYACAKLFGHYVTINYREAYGMFACSGILFNHESCLRGVEFVTRKISEGVARIYLGLADSITLGNLEAKRDWGYAPEYVKAMWMMLQQKEPDDYVIATGESHSVREFVEEAFKVAGIEKWEKYVKFDPKLLRPAEVPELRGDYSKAKRKFGWEPKVKFKELVRIMVEADIERLRRR